MARETVSVVVPTYNRAHCLPRTIDSVLQQTHRDLELIVVDDGSSDGTEPLVARLYGRDPRVRYVRQENRGVSAARNHGFRLVSGSYVALLDSDDVWLPWKLELQLACLRAVPRAGMVWTDMSGVDPQGRVSHERYLRVMYGAYHWFPTNDALFEESLPLRDVAPSLAAATGENRVYAGDVVSAMVMGSLVHTSTVLMRRERQERVGGFEESFATGEDYDFHLRTCREGPVAYADLPTIHYQRGMPDRLTRHGLPMAKHVLLTLTRVLRDDRERISLPPWMIRCVLAHAHEWLGEEHLAQGTHWRAAGHFAISLRHRASARNAAMLAFASLPAPVADLLRAGYRRAKRADRPVASPSARR